MTGRRSAWWVFFAAVAIGAGAWAWRSWFAGDEQLETVPDEVLVNFRPVEVPANGYSHSNECRTCHPGNFASWHASYHRTMTQVASPESVHGPLPAGPFTFDGRRYQLEQRGEQLWVRMHDPDARLNAREPDATWIERPLALVTGSHHLQLYWYATGESRVLGLVPVHFFKDDRQWLPASATLLRPPAPFSSDTGRWNRRCIQCHATHGRTRPGGDPRNPIVDTQVAEFGISCEACHGPAAAHIEARRGVAMAGPAPADTIVNPAKLSAHLSSQVCGSCHSFTLAKDDRSEMRALQEGSDYRPGNELTQSMVVLRRDAQHRELLKQRGLNPDEQFDQIFWRDGMVRVAGREYNGLVESACHTRGNMSCLTCHSLHKRDDDTRSLSDWADRQIKPGFDADRACFDCHDNARYAAESHTHHASESTGSRCYNCHMPHTTYGLLRAMRSHQIDSPNVAVTKRAGRPNACNLCHLDRSLGWTAAQLSRWYGHEVPELTDDEQNVSLAARHVIAGDAAQRAIAGWHLGWQPARDVSGEDWMPPLLMQLLRDDYDVVRMIGSRSLRNLAGFADVAFDPIAPAAQREEALRAIEGRWQTSRSQRAERPSVLIKPDGDLDRETFDRLLRDRDQRPVVLLE